MEVDFVLTLPWLQYVSYYPTLLLSPMHIIKNVRIAWMDYAKVQLAQHSCPDCGTSDTSAILPSRDVPCYLSGQFRGILSLDVKVLCSQFAKPVINLASQSLVKKNFKLGKWL